jgi:hypothetical protein
LHPTFGATAEGAGVLDASGGVSGLDYPANVKVGCHRVPPNHFSASFGWVQGTVGAADLWSWISENVGDGLWSSPDPVSSPLVTGQPQSP